MTRKLFSIMLCAFALLLLMGAGTTPKQAAALLAEEESAVAADGGVLEIDLEALGRDAVSAARGISPIEAAKKDECILLIDGEQAPEEVKAVLRDGVTYVALAELGPILDETAKVGWDEASGTVTVTTERLSLTAQVGDLYLEANGRYLYLPEGVQVEDGRLTVPLWAMAKAFDAQLTWDSLSRTAAVTSGGGAIQSGDEFYDEESLFWLSRIIYAESGNQPLEGKMAVGNVVMNRVADPAFPDTVEEVLAQKNQFSPYKGGRLANRTPNEGSVIAAKLVLDGGVVDETEGALYFNSRETSWVSQTKECIAVIGGHSFYR